MDKRICNRQRIVAALAVMDDGETAADLLGFMSNPDMDACKPLVEAYSNEADPESAMNRIVKHLMSAEKFSSLSEVHPAWLLEHLRVETPRIVGIILRFLPSKHVRFLLKNLPPMMCEQIPKMIESFSVPPDILDVVRRKFEKNFIPMRTSRDIERPSFENIYYLREHELCELFCDLGLTEMAIALSVTSSKVLKIIYNRLDVKDAKRLKGRIRALSGISPTFFRQARSKLLQIEGEAMGPKQFLKALGLSAFAEAAADGCGEVVRMIQQKLDPSDGYLLKRFVDERRMRPSPISQSDRQEMVLKAIAMLAREGRIDGSWQRFWPSYEVVPDTTEPHLPAAEDETNTAHQLA